MPTALIASTRGSHHPLGATAVPSGVNFALYSRHASAVNLLLFNAPDDAFPSAVIPLEQRTRFVWHALVQGLRPGQLYGYQVHGPHDPARGHRFDPRRLLVDPYARALTGSFDRDWLMREAASAPTPCGSGAGGAAVIVEDAERAPKCVVVDDAFDWEGDVSPGIPMQDSIIYETHVKGLTASPSSAVRYPGTYLGVIEKIPYLASLGVTALELLPVQHAQDDVSVLRRSLTNYWGYMTLGYFAPDSRFSTRSWPGCQVHEFKTMVKALHRAGIEVLLDVVFNHTCEGGADGPTLSWRGIDNATYYALASDDRSRYLDHSGCGNSLRFSEPQVIKMVMDCLRFWVEVMHVDGFRLDLPTAIGRREAPWEQTAAFLCAIHQDPVLSRVKLIAEPWDLQHRTRRAGPFPIDWAEWNVHFRDCARRFTKGDASMSRALSQRLLGSPDLYGSDGRTPYHSINYVTSHDGFTLRDLVTYSERHNEANHEGNTDGDEINHSWNWGVEGETGDPSVQALRRRLMKNLFATLLLARGVPMISGGDEIMRTQRGNNNAYAQDNELSWYDWGLGAPQREMLRFVRALIALRKKYPHLRAGGGRPATGRGAHLEDVPDVSWHDEHLDPVRWDDPEVRALAWLMHGSVLDDVPRAAAEDLLVLFNAHWEEITFRLPPAPGTGPWCRVLDTSLESGEELAVHDPSFVLPRQDGYCVPARSVVALSRRGQGTPARKRR